MPQPSTINICHIYDLATVCSPFSRPKAPCSYSLACSGTSFQGHTIYSYYISRLAFTDLLLTFLT